MDLYTRCTQCETVFRVTTGDLQASGGQVRCGRCQTVFDAFASLTAKAPQEAKEESAPRTNRLATPDDAPAALSQPVPRNSELHKPEAQKPTPAVHAATVGAAKTETEKTATRPPFPLTVPIFDAVNRFDDDPATNLYEWEFKPAPKLPRTGLWLSLSLFLVVAAVAQAAYVFRTQLMVNYPQVRPVYEQVCVWISCRIGLPRLTDQLNIETSDLQLVNPQKPNQVELTALVRNRARVAVEYPAFELTLTNAKEQVIVRRVFLPDAYLSEATSVEDGLAGRKELAVRLFLDTGSLRATGYRIYLFYPT